MTTAGKEAFQLVLPKQFQPVAIWVLRGHFLWLGIGSTGLEWRQTFCTMSRLVEVMWLGRHYPARQTLPCKTDISLQDP